ncbi:Microtubule-binding calmodulin-regulated spectrin-associated protein [Giardia muris]|uniref:Microtubule-binding calmodulin-regulated spectrin-associated protein n=1 Tax=Giardia muris TaxID=5742 RepID=A0A4Z1T4G7_GIAMU|nr:Microtubule-binding calmodulin-regulated spectrin-associated protein [Giardia muris]|eukprot:TNJ28893.1 Microtubule-binding calmodulin-regulated spectrin-associated protein [Giardia muris]
MARSRNVRPSQNGQDDYFDNLNLCDSIGMFTVHPPIPGSVRERPGSSVRTVGTRDEVKTPARASIQETPSRGRLEEQLCQKLVERDKQIATLTAENEEMLAQTTSLQTLVESMQHELDDLRQQLRAKTQELVEANANLELERIYNSEAQERYLELQQDLDFALTENEELREQLQQAGIMPPLSGSVVRSGQGRSPCHESDEGDGLDLIDSASKRDTIQHIPLPSDLDRDYRPYDTWDMASTTQNGTEKYLKSLSMTTPTRKKPILEMASRPGTVIDSALNASPVDASELATSVITHSTVDEGAKQPLKPLENLDEDSETASYSEFMCSRGVHGQADGLHSIQRSECTFDEADEVAIAQLSVSIDHSRRVADTRIERAHKELEPANDSMTASSFEAFAIAGHKSQSIIPQLTADKEHSSKSTPDVGPGVEAGTEERPAVTRVEPGIAMEIPLDDDPPDAHSLEKKRRLLEAQKQRLYELRDRAKQRHEHDEHEDSDVRSASTSSAHVSPCNRKRWESAHGRPGAAGTPLEPTELKRRAESAVRRVSRVPLAEASPPREGMATVSSARQATFGLQQRGKRSVDVPDEEVAVPFRPSQILDYLPPAQFDNSQLIQKLITQNLLPGSANYERRMVALDGVASARGQLLVVLRDSERKSYHSCVLVDEDTGRLIKVDGPDNMPSELPQNIIETMFKYDSSARSFQAVDQRQLSTLVVAVTLRVKRKKVTMR